MTLAMTITCHRCTRQFHWQEITVCAKEKMLLGTPSSETIFVKFLSRGKSGLVASLESVVYWGSTLPKHQFCPFETTPINIQKEVQIAELEL